MTISNGLLLLMTDWEVGQSSTENFFPILTHYASLGRANAHCEKNNVLVEHFGLDMSYNVMSAPPVPLKSQSNLNATVNSDK